MERQIHMPQQGMWKVWKISRRHAEVHWSYQCVSDNCDEWKNLDGWLCCKPCPVSAALKSTSLMLLANIMAVIQRLNQFHWRLYLICIKLTECCSFTCTPFSWSISLWLKVVCKYNICFRLLLAELVQKHMFPIQGYLMSSYFRQCHVGTWENL